MAITRFRQAGAVGVVSDIPHIDLPVNAFNDALNVRFRGSKVDSIGGWQNIFPVINNADYTPFTVAKRPLVDIFYFGTEKYFYSVNVTGSATTITNITPHWNTGDLGTGADYPSWDGGAQTQKIVDINIDPNVKAWNTLNDKWNTTIISDLVVFNSARYKPVGQTTINDATSPLVTIPGWGFPKASDWDLADVENPVPKPNQTYYDWSTGRISTYKQFLIALGMREGRVDQSGNITGYDDLPNRIRWSDVAFEGALPTNWIEDSDQGNLGGFNDLIDAQSEILDGLQLRDSFIIYTGSETYIMNLTGGDTLFSFEKLFPDAGIMSPGCVAEFDGKHFVVGSNDVYVHDGSQKQSVIEGRIRDRLVDEISSVNYKATRVYTNPAKKEIWVCYPYTGIEGDVNNAWYCNRAAIYNWEFSTWSFATIPNVYDIAIGSILPNTDQKWSDLIGTEGTTPTSPPDDIWEGSTPNMVDRHWSPFVNGLGNQYLYAASDDGCLYILDQGNYEEKITYADPTKPKDFIKSNNPHICRIKRDGIDFDEQEPIAFGMKCIRNIYPQMDGDAELRFEIGTNDSRGDPVTVKNVAIYNVASDYKVDCFSTGRFHSINMQSVNQGNWTFTGWDIDYVNMGKR